MSPFSSNEPSTPSTQPSTQTSGRTSFGDTRLPALSVTALAAALTISGCGREPTVYEQVQATPQGSIKEVLAHPEQYLGSTLRFDLTPTRTGDSSTISWYRDSHFLNLSVRYDLRDLEGNAIELIDDRRFSLDGGAETSASAAPASLYYLPANTVAVAGVVKKYSNADQPYISLQLAVYDPNKVTPR